MATARRYGIRKFDPPERPDRSQDGHNEPEPTAGHEQGVPRPKPVLPGTHHYADPAPPAEHRPLDVGPAKPYYSGGMAHGVPAPPQHGGRPAPPSDKQLAERVREETRQEEGKPVEPVPVWIVERGSGSRPLKRAALRQVTIAAAGADPQVLVPRNPHRSKVRLLNESAASQGPTVTTAGGPVTAAGAGTVIATWTVGQAATYTITVTLSVGGTATAADKDNMGLYVGGVLTAVLPASTNTSPQASAPTVLALAAGQVVTVQQIAAAGGASTYYAIITATPAAAPGAAVRISADLTGSGGALLPAAMTGYLEIVTQDEICAYCPAGGPALISVIDSYDVPGGG